MGDLFTSLRMATRSMAAQQFALETVGHNIANVNTEGYTRRVTDFAAVPPTVRWDAGDGVEVQGVRAIRDGFLDQRLWRELPDQQKQAAMADSLAIVETALGDPGSSIDGKLTEFFDSFATLADDPTSATARQQVISQGQALGTAFSEMVSRLRVAQSDTDTRIRDTVDQINGLAARVADLNHSIGNAQATGIGLDALKDEQAQAVQTLAGLANIHVMQRQDGGVDLTIGSGRALVIGETDFQITTSPTPPLGMSTLTSNGFNLTSEITSGALGGLISVRDTTLPGYISRLDDIAYTLSSQVNSLTTAGYDFSGAAGLAFFTPIGSATGAAGALTVNAAVAADPSKVVAAGVAFAGDNGVAKLVANLRDSKVMLGNTATLTDAWGRVVYQAGLDAQTAKNDASVRGEIVRQVQALRDSVSGVSLDEEAANMIKFQRAYEANAKYFITVNTAIDTLFSLVDQ
jgi:flagellar hook-associated protein 1 FlgK